MAEYVECIGGLEVDAELQGEPARGCERIRFAAVLDHEIYRGALTLPRVTEVMDAEILYALRRDREVFLEVAAEVA